MRVRQFAPEEITPFHVACLDAIVDSGIPHTPDLNDMDENVGAAMAPVNIWNGIRWNASFAYLDPVRDKKGLTIAGDVLVDKINVDGSRAASVDVVHAGGKMTIEAGQVVLCAGAYGSPAVLLRSGMGPSRDLPPLGISTRIDLPGVGANLHDHPSFNLSYHGTPLFKSLMEEFIASGRSVFAEQSLAKTRSSHCSQAFDLHIAPVASPAPDPSGHWQCKILVANMAPKSRGHLTLRDADPQSSPVIDTGYLTDPEDDDIAVLMDGVNMSREIAARPSLAELIGKELEDTANLDSIEAVRRNSLHYYHPVGACKMGLDSDPAAVVDPTGKVYGLDNLYVADVSIMPVVPRANTNLPTLMIAEHIAASLH